MGNPQLIIPEGWYTYREMEKITGKSLSSLSSAAAKGSGFERHQIYDSEGGLIATFIKRKVKS